MGKNKFFNQDEIDEQNTSFVQDTQHSSFNSRGNFGEDYSDQIYVDASRGKEAMFDRKNPLVRLILLVLGCVAIIGTVYYIYVYITTMK